MNREGVWLRLAIASDRAVTRLTKPVYRLSYQVPVIPRVSVHCGGCNYDPGAVPGAMSALKGIERQQVIYIYIYDIFHLQTCIPYSPRPCLLEVKRERVELEKIQSFRLHRQGYGSSFLACLVRHMLRESAAERICI